MTYDETIKDAILLADKIDGSAYDAIHPIPAGGIAIGVTMANELGIEKILSVEEYKNYLHQDRVLVVDDLVDSGKTLERYKNSDCAVLYKKPHSPIPTYYLKEIGSEWVTFPHEKDKDGILDHVTRVFSFVDIRLSEKEEELILNLLNSFKRRV